MSSRSRYISLASQAAFEVVPFFLVSQPSPHSCLAQTLPLMWWAGRPSLHRPDRHRSFTEPGGLFAFPGLFELQSHKRSAGLLNKWKRMGKKRKEAGKKTTPEVNVVRRNSNQMNPSLFLPFPLPKTHQAHPVSLSEDGLVMVFYRADGTKMCNPRTPRDLRDGDIESDLKMKATLWR